jgi:hypothetical protein
MSTIHKDANVEESSRDASDGESASNKFKTLWTDALTLIFIVAAVGLAAHGLDTMLTYDSSYGPPDKVVGGDAYNYIIRATRGVGFIMCGVISAVFANITSNS